MADSIIIDGLTVAVEQPRAATRPPLLFVHGINVGGWVFANYMQWFAARGFPCYALDLRGHYGSRPVADLGRVTIADYVTDVIDVARALTRRAEAANDGAESVRPVIVGHSMGGLVAQQAAGSGAAHALVLLAPAPPRGIPLLSLPLLTRTTKYVGRMMHAEPLLPTFDDVAALVFNRVSAERHAALYARFVPESGLAARQLALGTVSVQAAAVRCPVLVVAGTEDRTIPPAVARRVAARYRADVLEYPGHAHFLVDEPGWEEPAEGIVRWLERVVAQPATS